MRAPLWRQPDVRLVFLLLVILYGYFVGRLGGNAGSRLGLVFAIVHEGRLTIDSYHMRGGTKTWDKAFYEGHYYCDKGVGGPLIGLVAYLPIAALGGALGLALTTKVASWLITMLVVGIPSALAGTLLFVTARRAVGSPLPAFVATIAVYLGTMCWPYGCLFYGHMIAAWLIVLAFLLTRRSRPFLLGLVLGLALITEYPTGLLGLVIGLYFVDFERRRGSLIRPLVLACAGGFVPLMILLAYNMACFGHPFSLGYHHEKLEEFRTGMSQGLVGVGWPRLRVVYYTTFHPTQGIFWHSPVLLLIFPGLVAMLRDPDRRREACVAGASLVAYLLFNSGYYMWWGGAAFGPRHLIPMLPLLVLPLAFAAHRFPRTASILAAISILQMLVVCATTPGIPDVLPPVVESLYFFEYHPIYDWNLVELAAGRMARNFGDLLTGIQGPITLLPPLLALAAAWAWFVRFNADARRARAPGTHP